MPRFPAQLHDVTMCQQPLKLSPPQQRNKILLMLQAEQTFTHHGVKKLLFVLAAWFSPTWNFFFIFYIWSTLFIIVQGGEEFRQGDSTNDTR